MHITDYNTPQMCSCGHVWTTPMFNQLGGGFYVDENNGPICPVCGNLDSGDPELAEKRLEAQKAAGKHIPHVGPKEPREIALLEPDGAGFYITRSGEMVVLTHQELNNNWRGYTSFYSSTWWYPDGCHNLHLSDDIVRKMPK